MALQAPILSAFDPVVAGEGSIDPLGTLATYERLAERIYPYVTARMSRIRFLTAIAVGAVVCEQFSEDEVAADGITPPWLVFEWYAVEAFVRCRDQFPRSEASRFPGSQKVDSVVQERLRLSSGTYLKSPKVFGFTGVYKRLAEGLEIVSDDLRLDDGAFQLLARWEQEQGLRGFITQGSGPGAEFKKELHDAIADGLRQGYTRRPPGWRGWETLASCLHPGRVKRDEAAVLFDRFVNPQLGTLPADPAAARARQVLVQELIRHGSAVSREDEAGFLRGVNRTKDEEIVDRLAAIDAYEGLCRAIEDAFRLILHLSTERAGAPVTADDLGATELGSSLPARTRAAARRIVTVPSLVEREPQARELADRYGAICDTGELFEALLEHHETIQAGKPPEPKRPWFERMPRGGIAVRPQYSQDEAPEGADVYVHDYRTASVSSFLQDLGRLPR